MRLFMSRDVVRVASRKSRVLILRICLRTILFGVGTILRKRQICQVFFSDGSVLSSRPTGFSVFAVSPCCNGFRRFYHHGGTEKTENALIQSQVRHYFSDEVIFFALPNTHTFGERPGQSQSFPRSRRQHGIVEILV